MTSGSQRHSADTATDGNFPLLQPTKSGFLHHATDACLSAPRVSITDCHTTVTKRSSSPFTTEAFTESNWLDGRWYFLCNKDCEERRIQPLGNFWQKATQSAAVFVVSKEGGGGCLETEVPPTWRTTFLTKAQSKCLNICAHMYRPSEGPCSKDVHMCGESYGVCEQLVTSQIVRLLENRLRREVKRQFQTSLLHCWSDDVPCVLVINSATALLK